MEVNAEKVSALLNSPEPDKRRQGIVLTVKLDLSALRPDLTRIAGSDENHELRALARKGLERLNSRQSPQNQDEKFAHVSFEQLLQSEDPYARFAGLKKALIENTGAARLCILTALKKEQIPQLKASMIMGMGRFGRKEDIVPLSDFLRDSDSRVRANCVEALASIGGEEANRHIITLMSDQDNRVKANVIKSLKGLGGPGLLELLKKMVQDERIWMRASAVFAFSKIKSPQSLVMLGQIAAHDKSPEIRQKAISQLEMQKSEGNPAAGVILEKLKELEQPQDATSSSVPEYDSSSEFLEGGEGVKELLQNEDPCKRYLAVSAVGEDFATHKEIFLEAFKVEQDTFLLSMMLTIVKENKPSDAIMRCIQLLSHEDDRVRANAVEAAAAVEISSSADDIYKLLDDKNSRVAANAVMALGQIGRVDTFAEVKKLLKKGREAFRQSALYIISLQKDHNYVPLLRQLLQDASPKVRDKAFDILKLYVHKQVPGALKVLQDVEQRISLEKNREHFFENNLDHMFASLVHMIKSDKNDDEDKVVFEKTPEAEKQALLKLAEKIIEHGLADNKHLEMLQNIEKELASLNALIQKSDSEDTDVDSGIAEKAQQMSEAELLRIEKKSLQSRQEAMLIAMALDIYGIRATLDHKSRALIRVELARVEGSLCTHVPAGEFSVLPPNDAPVSEIFDVAMRLYQKHVWTFSYVTGIQFFKWLFLLFLMGMGMAALKANPIIGLLILVILIPAFAYKTFILMTEWKIKIACMVDDYIHGREGGAEIWDAKTQQLFSHVLSCSLRKYFFLAAWGVMGLIIGGIVVVGSESFLRLTFLASMGKLVGSLLFIYIVSTVYFKYMLIEPIAVLKKDVDPFTIANEIYMKNKVKISTLIIFSYFIMALIGGYSLQLLSFVLPTLPGNASNILLQVLASISEVCLLPITYACIVVYSLMHFRKKKANI
jgi:HEAT repeat protein